MAITSIDLVASGLVDSFSVAGDLGPQAYKLVTGEGLTALPEWPLAVTAALAGLVKLDGETIQADTADNAGTTIAESQDGGETPQEIDTGASFSPVEGDNLEYADTATVNVQPAEAANLYRVAINAPCNQIGGAYVTVDSVKADAVTVGRAVIDGGWTAGRALGAFNDNENSAPSPFVGLVGADAWRCCLHASNTTT